MALGLLSWVVHLRIESYGQLEHSHPLKQKALCQRLSVPLVSLSLGVPRNVKV